MKELLAQLEIEINTITKEIHELNNQRFNESLSKEERDDYNEQYYFTLGKRSVINKILMKYEKTIHLL